jgi:hypothetical protein
MAKRSVVVKLELHHLQTFNECEGVWPVQAPGLNDFLLGAGFKFLGGNTNVAQRSKKMVYHFIGF